LQPANPLRTHRIENMWYEWGVTLHVNVQTTSRSMRIDYREVIKVAVKLLKRKYLTVKGFLCLILDVNLIFRDRPSRIKPVHPVHHQARQ
jgi:hypothetical protein